MKSMRLTKTTREDIAASVCTAFTTNWYKTNCPKYKDRFELTDAATKERIRIMKDCWESVYGKYAEILKQLPKDLRSDSRFSLFVSSRGSFYLEDRDFPGKNVSGYDVQLDAEEFERLFYPYLQMIDLRDRFDKELSAYMLEVTAVLESVKTTGQLVELWPTVEPFIPAHVIDPDKGVRLPALLISRLDERLGVSS